MRQPNPLELIRAKRLILEMALNGPRRPGHASVCLHLQAELDFLLSLYPIHSLGSRDPQYVESDINHPVSLKRAQEIEIHYRLS